MLQPLPADVNRPVSVMEVWTKVTEDQLKKDLVAAKKEMDTR